MTIFRGKKIFVKGKNVIYNPLRVEYIKWFFICCAFSLYYYMVDFFATFKHSCPYISDFILVSEDNISMRNSCFITDYNETFPVKNCVNFLSDRIDMFSAVPHILRKILYYTATHIYNYTSSWWTAIKLERSSSKCDRRLIKELSELRIICVRSFEGYSTDPDIDILALQSHENVAIFGDLMHPNLLTSIYEHDEVYFNLKTFMLSITWEKMRGNFPPFIDIVIYLRDIIDGLEYLHDRRIYHLNLVPKNILIVSSPVNKSGMAKITGFDYAVQCEERTISYQRIGLEGMYRPPGYHPEGRVNPANVDLWGLGITAYELFTGGMISIFAEIMLHELLLEIITRTGMSPSEMLTSQEFFSSAMEASWHSLEFISGFKSVIQVDGTFYNTRPIDFHRDAYNFVASFMQQSRQETTLNEARESPLIKKVINPKISWFTRKFLMPTYRDVLLFSAVVFTLPLFIEPSLLVLFPIMSFVGAFSFVGFKNFVETKIRDFKCKRKIMFS